MKWAHLKHAVRWIKTIYQKYARINQTHVSDTSVPPVISSQ